MKEAGNIYHVPVFRTRYRCEFCNVAVCAGRYGNWSDATIGANAEFVWDKDMHNAMRRKLTYPFFLPDEKFVTRPPSIWSRAEACEHFEWFLSVWQKRVEDFAGCAGIMDRADVATSLLRGDEFVRANLLDSEFREFTASIPTLTSAGRALAADMGLLLAHLLIVSSAKVHWEVVERPKSDLSFNLPVLKGFGVVYLNPLRAGVSHYAMFLAENRVKNSWRETYDFWLARADSG